MRIIATFLMAMLVSQPCWAWSEPGHHIVAVLAYDLLTKDEQQHLLEVLSAHPRFADDFDSKDQTLTKEEMERWVIGRAGYWPDVARSQPKFNRPTWHYQLGATLTIGDPNGVPANPGPAPSDATLETTDLHITQAIEVCRRVLREKSSPSSDHALAVCWLAHLVGDAHQPCHAGSLYVTGVFPEGDRGANSIPTKQSRNMHALWDGLFGNRYDAGDIRRRWAAIKADSVTWNVAKEAAAKADGLQPLTCLSESAEFGRTNVYTPEVLESVQAVARGLTPTVATVDLSEAYLKAAGEVARKRAAFAGHRLARILSEDLR